MTCEDCDTPMIEVEHVDYLDPVFILGRTIALHGITVERCQKCNYDAPIYPRLGQLAPLVRENPDKREFYWDDRTREWSLKNEL